jgi:hypothetical protein
VRKSSLVGQVDVVITLQIYVQDVSVQILTGLSAILNEDFVVLFSLPR